MKVTPGEDAHTLALEGDFDAAATGAVEAHLTMLLEAAAPSGTPVVLDFERVPYMDSAGFSGWVSLERRCLDAGRPLQVARAPALIRQLFVFADLEEVLVA